MTYIKQLKQLNPNKIIPCQLYSLLVSKYSIRNTWMAQEWITYINNNRNLVYDYKTNKRY